MCCCFLADVFVKYALVTANIVFSVFGIVLIAVGAIVLKQVKELEGGLLPDVLNPFSIGIIVVGCAIFVISFLACCGAIRRSRWMLLAYAAFMAILAGIKIFFTVIIFVFLDQAINTATSWLQNAFEQESLRESFHSLEKLFQCCGTTGPDSYLPVGVIPATCCASPVNGQCVEVEQMFEGCNSKVGSYFETYGVVIGAILITMIVIEVICMISGLYLSCHIRPRKQA